MARRLHSSIVLFTLLVLIGCSSTMESCDDSEPGDLLRPGDVESTLLVLDVYRCGTDFNDIVHYVEGDGPGDETIPVVVGNDGIMLIQPKTSPKFNPVNLGIVNDLNAVYSPVKQIEAGGDGSPPGTPGVFMDMGGLANTLSFPDHPATGNVTGVSGESWFVTSAGEVVTKDDDGSLVIVFTEPGGAGFTATHRQHTRAVAVGPGGLVWQADRDPSESWTTANWTNISVPNGPDLEDVYLYPDGASSYNIYAVGENEIWSRADDAAWQLEIGPLPGDLYSVDRMISGQVYAVGTQGLTVTYDGSSWDHNSVGNNVQLRGVTVNTEGGGYACGDDGVLLQKSGDTWVDLGYSNVSPWNDIDGLSSDEIYAANGDTLMGWDGVDWEPIATNFNEITSLHAVSSDRIWITSRSADGVDNFIQVWIGNMFYMSHHSSMDPFNSIWCDAPGDTVLVAANNGYVFRNGGVGGWEWITADPARKHFYDLDGTSAHDVFAVGQDGMIARFNGASWKLMDSGVTDTLRAISGNIAVGDNGAITRWDGSAWKAEDAGTTAHLNAVCLIGGKEAWAVGDGGVIISSDGAGEWTVYERSLYTVELRSVWGANSGDIWFGGETGYLLRHQP